MTSLSIGRRGDARQILAANAPSLLPPPDIFSFDQHCEVPFASYGAVSRCTTNRRCERQGFTATSTLCFTHRVVQCMLEGNRTPQKISSGLSIVSFEHIP